MACARYLPLVTETGITEVPISTGMYEVLEDMRFTLSELQAMYSVTMAADGEILVWWRGSPRAVGPLHAWEHTQYGLAHEVPQSMQHVTSTTGLTPQEVLAILCAGWNTMDVAVCRTVSLLQMRAIRQKLLDIFHLKEMGDGTERHRV